MQVFLTPEYLGIVMEYASDGELFDYVASKGRMVEAEARYFFQQLICGVEYCHKMVLTHPRVSAKTLSRNPSDVMSDLVFCSGFRCSACEWGLPSLAHADLQPAWDVL